MDWAQGWGSTIVIGVAGPATVTIPTRYLLAGRSMKGTLYGGYKPKTDLPELVEQYLRKVLSTFFPTFNTFLSLATHLK